MKIMDELILFFSRVFLSKFSLEALYNTWVWGVYIMVCMWNAKGQIFPNRVFWRLGLATGLGRELIVWPAWDFCPILQQLAWLFSSSAYFTCVPAFGDLLATRSSRESLQNPHFWIFLHTLSHTTLTWFPPKYKISKYWITSKLARNKANRMVD